MKKDWKQWLENIFFQQGKRLIAWFPFGLALGISAYFSCHDEPSHFFIGSIIGVALSGICLLFAALRYPSLGLTILVSGGAILSIALGFSLAALEGQTRFPIPALPRQSVWTEGWVKQVEHLSSFGKSSGERVRVTLENVWFDSPWERNSKPLDRYLRVTLKKNEQFIPQTGDKIRIRVLFHPFLEPYWPYGRDLQREAWFSSLAGNGRALSSPYCIVHSKKYALTRWREHIALRIMTIYPGQNGAIIATLLSGETGYLTAKTRQEFSASGLAHLLAVAGLHLGLVIGICFTIFLTVLVRSEYSALFWPCRDIALWASLILGGVYILLTGAHLPSVRALGMAVYAVIAVQMGRRALSLRALAFVAIILECIHPAVILDVSFQMSMVAVMAIISGYDELRSSLNKLQRHSWFWARWGMPIVMGVLTSVLAGTATLPLSMVHFGHFQPWFVLANVIAVPLMGVWVMPLGLMALVLMPFGCDAPALYAMGWGVEVIRFLARQTSYLPGASIAVPSWPEWGILLIMAGITIFCLWRGKARWGGLLLAILGVASAWFVSEPIIIMSPDGRSVAFHTSQGWMIDPVKGNILPAETWKRNIGFKAGFVPEECHKNLCFFDIMNHKILFDLRSPKVTDQRNVAYSNDIEICKSISLVVSYRDASSLCSNVPIIDKNSTYRDGAWAVYAQSKGKLMIVSDRLARGNRPWVLPVGSDGLPTLPLAKEE